MENRVLLSVIIPVHNGAKFIRKTVHELMKQTLSDFEIILVENHSDDDSYDLCRKLSDKEPRIKLLQSSEKGTSMARRLGVENAEGVYTVFADQDDHYIDNKALEEMVRLISDDETDICQFSYYKEYLPFARRKIEYTDEHKVFTEEQIRKRHIIGVFGAKGCFFDTTVWSKIYRTDLLKEAVSHVHEELYYAEDEYLNIWAFSSPLLNSVSVRNEAFYCWKTTTGFSSSSSNGEALLRDYEIVKPLAEEVALKSKNIMVISYVHTEAINCFLAIFMDMVRRKVPEETVLSKIDTYNNYQFMIKAKQYIREHPFLIRMWPDRKFLSSDYTAKEYYDYCLSQLDFEKQNRKGIYKTKFQKLKTVKLFNEK